MEELKENNFIGVANVIEEGRYGGPHSRILSVSERLLSKGVKTTIICPEKEIGRFYREALKKKLEILPISMNRLGKNPARILKYMLTFPKEVLALKKIFKSNKIDIVHCNSARQFKGVVAGRLSGKKVIWHLQDTFSPALIRGLFFITSFFADCFIVAGKKVQRYYLASFPLNQKPVTEIQAPVDTEFFVPKVSSVDQRLGPLPGLKVVSVGNINSAKGYEYFIDAASYFSDEDNAVSFWIVGGTIESQRSYYESLLKKAQIMAFGNFFFYGPSTDVRSVLEACDVYVCSSIHEASPISVWEAMSMGKAIVSTDVGDVKSFIKDGHNGFVVPVRNGKALADKVRVLVEDPYLRESFGKKARETAIKRLDLGVTVRKHVEVYDRCLNLRPEGHQ
ncbi:MAG: glycosyltransferase [Deltaproteobacteria bacterium]|nr:glycosyltransferase [Deltaproteobacteria bacterium]